MRYLIAKLILRLIPTKPLVNHAWPPTALPLVNDELLRRFPHRLPKARRDAYAAGKALALEELSRAPAHVVLMSINAALAKDTMYIGHVRFAYFEGLRDGLAQGLGKEIPDV